METKKVLQIITLKPDLVKDQNELNTYIQKGEDYKKELAKIDIVNDDNIETAKNLKSSITTAKTDIEKARKMLKAPILEIGKAIDSRAKELEKPFIEMQGEIKAKIDKYNEAEEKQKEIERQRIEGIIEKIKSFENLEELTKYYKSLEVKDQRKKLIADAGAVRKKEIVELEEKRELENFKKEIAEIKTTEDLQKVLLNPEDPKATEKQEIILNRKNAIKIEVLEKEKEEEKTKEKNTENFIEKLKPLSLEKLETGDFEKIPENVDSEKIENWINKRKLTLIEIAKNIETKKRKNTDEFKAMIKEKNLEALKTLILPLGSNETYFIEEITEFYKTTLEELEKVAQQEDDKRQNTERADKVIFDLLKDKLEKYTKLENLADFMDNIKDLQLEENKEKIKKLFVKKQEELLKKDQEKKEKEKSKTITDFYKKCGLTKDNQENYHIEETEREIKIFKLVDTLILTEGKAMEGMR